MQNFSSISIRGRLVRGATWSLFGSAFSQVLVLAGMALSARFLGPTNYGEVTLVQNTALMTALMTAPSFGLTATRYLAMHRASNPEACGTLVSTLLTLGVVVPAVFAIGFAIFHPLLTEQFTAFRFIAEHSLLFSTLFILSAFNSVQVGVLSGFEDFKGIAIANLIKGASVVVVVPFAAQHAGVSGAMGGLVFASAVGVLISAFVLSMQMNRHGVRRARPALMAVKDALVSFTLPSALATAITLPVMWWPNALLAQAQNGMYELGLFNAANQWRMGVAIVFSLITAPLLPALTSMYNGREYSRFARTIRKITWTVGLVSVAIAAVTYLLSVPITTALFGQGYSEVSWSLVLLTVSTIPSNVSSILGAAFQTFNLMWAGLLVNLLWSVVFGALCYQLHTYGSLGIALAFVTAYCVQAVASGFYLFSKLKSLENIHPKPVAAR